MRKKISKKIYLKLILMKYLNDFHCYLIEYKWRTPIPLTTSPLCAPDTPAILRIESSRTCDNIGAIPQLDTWQPGLGHRTSQL